MNSQIGLIIQWLIVLVGLVSLIYIAFAIKTEKKNYEDDSYSVSFGQVNMPIPNWWTMQKVSDTQVLFYRSDTKCNWEAQFHYVSEQMPLMEALDIWLEKNSAQFDPDIAIETDARHFIIDQSVAVKFEEAIRVEGTCTQNVEERIYVDLVLLRINGEKGYFLFQSVSSVLSGSVEGPYFEEALKRLTLILG